MKETKINANTIKGIGFLQSYERSNLKHIHECYENQVQQKLMRNFNATIKWKVKQDSGSKYFPITFIILRVDGLQKI